MLNNFNLFCVKINIDHLIPSGLKNGRFKLSLQLGGEYIYILQCVNDHVVILLTNI